jgi:hypothetical protein
MAMRGNGGMDHSYNALEIIVGCGQMVEFRQESTQN